MWTSQLSDASSAVCTRLSGIRSRSDSRSVTWTMSNPSSPGVRSMSPVNPNADSTRARRRQSPADEGDHTRDRPGAEHCVRTLDRVFLAVSPSSAAMSSSTSRRLAGREAGSCFDYADAASAGNPGRAAMPSRSLRGVRMLSGSTLIRTTAVRMRASLTKPTAGRAVNTTETTQTLPPQRTRVHTAAAGQQPDRPRRPGGLSEARAATVRWPMPMNAARRSNPSGCSGAAVRRFRWR